MKYDEFLLEEETISLEVVYLGEFTLSFSPNTIFKISVPHFILLYTGSISCSLGSRMSFSLALLATEKSPKSLMLL